jgi:hypothetical protein
MSDDGQVTLAVLAGLDVDASHAGLSKADRDKLAHGLAEHAHALAALKPYDVGPRMVELLGQALRKPVADVLGEVWKQRKELREATSAKGDGKPVSADVDLIDHSMRWTLKPSITISLKAAPAAAPHVTIDVEADVTLALHGLQIVIERARITKVKAGKLKSTVELKYHGFPLSAPYEKELDLAKEFVLPGNGIDLS